MNGSNEVNQAAQHSPLQKRLYLAGIAVFVAALIAAAIIYATTPPPDSAIAQYSMTDPRYQAELQQIGGNAAVLMAQFHQWFDGLWHGTALAFTVAVLGFAAALACFFIGYFFADGEAPHQ
jgi:ABC-type dipeptide/oligopeptide/nickel transport system permease component